MIQEKMLDTTFALEPSTIEIESMWSIVDSFRRGYYQKPPHQRERVWDSDKVSDWVERVTNRRLQPVGEIVTYQIDNGLPSPIFINDGFQRISATMEFLDNPSKFRRTANEAEQLTRSYKMAREHRIYSDHDEALVDFQHLNLGTALTPLEFCRGVLTYMPRYSEWQELFTTLHDIVPLNERRISSRRYKASREDAHKMMRSDFAMLHRFLQESPLPVDYKVTAAHVKPREVSNRSVIEWQLRDILDGKSVDEVKSSITKLQSLVDRETALMEEIWFGRMSKPRGQGISPTLYRWIIDCAIWRRNAKVPNDVWEDFITRVLESTSGKSQIVNVHDNSRYTLNLARISTLKAVCNIVGSTIYDYRPAKRKQMLVNLRGGYDESHLLPFSQYGNGETVAESAGRNRARGSRPVADGQQ